MNEIIKRLSGVRKELNQMKLKKNGKNKNVGFEYYELKDVLPSINNLNEQYGLIDNLSFNDNEVVLTIYAIDSPEKIEFKMPFKYFERNNKLQQDIQHFGSLQTYYRRYMYLLAYNISEGEIIDSLDQRAELTNEIEAKCEQATTTDELRNIYIEYRESYDTKKLTGIVERYRILLEGKKWV